MSLPASKVTSTSTKLSRAQRATDTIEQPVDSRFRQLKAKVLPDSPYILHARSTYQQSPEHADLWRIGTPFDLDEEELQYLTFKDRTNDLTPGLICRGGWDDGKGGLAPPEGPCSITSSDGTPPQGQGQKKKISLADYNRRDKHKVVGTTLKSTCPTPNEQFPANATVENHDAIVKAFKPILVEQSGQKRSADAMSVENGPVAFEQTAAGSFAKKAKTSSEPQDAALSGHPDVIPQRTNIEIGIIKDSSDAQTLKTQTRLKTERLASANHTEPSIPAPRMNSDKLNSHGLPPMLSPTLPVEIETELAKLTPSIQRRSNSAAKSKKLNATSKFKQQKSENSISSADEEGAKASGVGEAFALSKASTAPVTALDKNQRSPSLLPSAPRQPVKKNMPKGVTPTKLNGLLNSPVLAPVTAPTTPHRTEKRRLRALLKIKKKTNRKNLAQYLRLPPTPGKYPHFRSMVEREQRSRTPQFEQKNANNLHDNRFESQSKPKRNDAEAPEVGTKQRKSPDHRTEPELPAKRRKTPGWLPPNAHTPKQPSTSSPAPPNSGGAPRPQLLTPKADLKSAPMLRAESHEGSTTTPHGLALNGTPKVPDAGNRCDSVPSSGGRKPSSHDVKRDASRYLKQATDLKHASDVFLKDKLNQTDTERKRGVMIGTESVLCYILAFTLFDEPQRQFGQFGNVESWKSMLRLLDLISREAQPFKHLTGLILQLEGIIRDYMVCYEFQRLDHNPLEQKSSDTVTSDPAKTKEECKAAAYHVSFHEFRRYFEKSQTAWRSGLDLLKTSDIESEYPMTWAKRERYTVLPVKSADVVIQGEYQRKFNLPMGSLTSGLQAVSFGMSFLEEWSKKNGVEWEPKLEL